MPRATKPDIEPGNVPLDDEPTPAPKRGRGRPPGKAKKKETAPAAEPKKESEPRRSHHKRPGPSLDQVKAGLAVVGGLAQNGIAYVTIDKATGRSPVERVALSEDELDRAANVLADRLVRIPSVASAFAVIANVSKASPLAREATAIAAPRLARLGLLPPTVARMLGVSAEDIQAGITYRQESIARDKARRAEPRGGTRTQTADPRDRVPQREPVVEASATVDDRPLPNVGVPPEAYRARGTEVAPIEPSPSPRGAGGADSLSGT